MSVDNLDGKWISSRDEEHYSASVGHDTREQAIAHAPVELGIEPGDVFWTGRASVLLLPNISPSTILEQFRLDLDDEGGDADEALDVSKEEEADLGVMLNKTVEAWAEKHEIKVNAYSVHDVEKHVVPESAS